MIRMFFIITEPNRGRTGCMVAYDTQGEEKAAFEVNLNSNDTKQSLKEQSTFLENMLNSIEEAGHEIISVYYRTVSCFWSSGPCYEIIARIKES